LYRTLHGLKTGQSETEGISASVTGPTEFDYTTQDKFESFYKKKIKLQN